MNWQLIYFIYALLFFLFFFNPRLIHKLGDCVILNFLKKIKPRAFFWGGNFNSRGTPFFGGGGESDVATAAAAATAKTA